MPADFYTNRNAESAGNKRNPHVTGFSLSSISKPNVAQKTVSVQSERLPQRIEYKTERDAR